MTNKPDPITQTWYILGAPWANGADFGTTIIAGSPDPHLATPIADMFIDWEDSERTEQKELDAARAIAAHIVDLHNQWRKLDESTT